MICGSKEVSSSADSINIEVFTTQSEKGFTMRTMKRGIASYGDVKVSTGVATADNIQLIQMLFDGLVESLRSAEGQIKRGAIEEKSRSLARAGKIVLGLQSALDFEQGGDIAKNLDELYGYVTRRLLHVNLHNGDTIAREKNRTIRK